MSLFFETLREQLQKLVCALRSDPQAELFEEGVESTSVLLVALPVSQRAQLRDGPHV